MEENRQKWTQSEMDQTKNRGLKIIEAKFAGEVVTTKEEGPEDKFTHRWMRIFPMLPRNADEQAFVVQGKTQKIYRVKGSKIEYVSSQKVFIPTKPSFQGLTQSGDTSLFFFTKKKMKKPKKHRGFSSEHHINLKEDPCLVYETKYGINQPSSMRPTYWGELKLKIGKDSEYGFPVKLGDERSPFYKNLYHVFLRTSVRTSAQTDNFLAQLLRKDEQISIRRTFLFQTKYRYLEDSRNKLLKSWSSLPDNFIYSNDIGPSQFFLKPKEANLGGRLHYFAQNDESMVTIGLIDLRTKKVVSKRDVCVYELFEGLEFTKVSELKKLISMKLNYSICGDFLKVQLIVELAYRSLEIAESLKPIDFGLRNSELKSKKRKFDTSLNRGVSETRKMSFVILNLFSGKVKQIRVISAFDLNANDQSLILTQRTPFELTLELISWNNSRFVDNTQSERKRMISQDPNRENSDEQPQAGPQKRTLTLSLDEELKRKCVDFSELKSISQILDDQVLVVTSTNFLLFDVATQKLLSSFLNADNIELGSFQQNAIEGDIMLNLSQKLKVQVVKLLVNGQGRLDFKLLGLIDFTSFKRDCKIHEIQYFRKVKDREFVIKTTVSYIQPPKLDEELRGILSVGFEIVEDAQSVLKFGKLRITSHKLEFKLGQRESIKGVYHQGSHLNYEFYDLTTNRRLVKQVPCPSLSQGEEKGDLVYQFSSPPQSLIHNMQIISTYVKNDRVFYFLLGEKKEIRAIGYTRKDNLMIDPVVVRSVSLDPLARIVFNKKTEKFRIFVYHYSEAGDKPNMNRLTLLDEDLREGMVIDIPGIRVITRVKVINSDCVGIVGYTDIVKEELSGRYSHLTKTLILDLGEMKFYELVSEDGWLFEEWCSYFERRVFGIKNGLNFERRVPRGLYLSGRMI